MDEDTIDLKTDEKALTFLRQEKDRTGVSVLYLIQNCDLAPGLTFDRLKYIYSGNIRYVKNNEYTSIIQALKILPDCGDDRKKRGVSAGYIYISPETIEEIKGHIKRTGVSAEDLVAKSGIASISAKTIRSWFYGHNKSTRKAYLDEVLQGWRKLPDLGEDHKQRALSAEYIDITPEIIEEIRYQIKRTDVTPNGLSRKTGITVYGTTINNWLSGRTSSACKEHVEKVLNEWRRLPDSRFVHITPQIVAAIKKEINRTGKGADAITGENQKASINGIEHHFISNVLSMRLKKVEVDKFDIMMSLWEGVPDKGDESLPEKPPKNCMWSKKKSDDLKRRIMRTGIPPSNFLKQGKDLPNGLDKKLLVALMSGHYEGEVRIQIIEYLDKLLHEWKKLPKRGSDHRNPFIRRGYIYISPEIIEEIKDHIKRTGVSPKNLVAKCAIHSFSARTIEGWLYGQSKSTRKEYLDTALHGWRKLPDREDGHKKRSVRAGYIHIPPEIIEEIKGHIKRTGVSPKNLVAKCGIGSFSANTIKGWLYGHRKCTRKVYLDKVLQEWRKLPSTSKIDLWIDEKAFNLLRKEKDRVGVSVPYLIQNCNLIPSLTCNRLRSIFSGKTRYLDRDEFTSIIEALKRVPDRAGDHKKRTLSAEYVDITPEIVEEIRCQIKRTGVTPSGLARKTGITIHGRTINNWLSGFTSSACKEHFYKALYAWRRLPDNPIIDITSEISTVIEKEIERTGVAAFKIIEINHQAKEYGITKSFIRDILLQRPMKVRADKLDVTMNLWKELPDKSEAALRKKRTWSSKMARDLKRRLKGAGLTPSKIIARKRDLPEGLDKKFLMDLLLGKYQGEVDLEIIEYLNSIGRKEAD